CVRVPGRRLQVSFYRLHVGSRRMVVPPPLLRQGAAPAGRPSCLAADIDRSTPLSRRRLLSPRPPLLPPRAAPHLPRCRPPHRRLPPGHHVPLLTPTDDREVLAAPFALARNATKPL